MAHTLRMSCLFLFLFLSRLRNLCTGTRSYYLFLHNNQHLLDALLASFDLNGHTYRIHPDTKKLEPLLIEITSARGKYCPL